MISSELSVLSIMPNGNSANVTLRDRPTTDAGSPSALAGSIMDHHS